MKKLILQIQDKLNTTYALITFALFCLFAYLGYLERDFLNISGLSLVFILSLFIPLFLAKKNNHQVLKYLSLFYSLLIMFLLLVVIILNISATFSLLFQFFEPNCNLGEMKCLTQKDLSGIETAYNYHRNIALSYVSTAIFASIRNNTSIFLRSFLIYLKMLNFVFIINVLFLLLFFTILIFLPLLFYQFSWFSTWLLIFTILIFLLPVGAGVSRLR